MYLLPKPKKMEYAEGKFSFDKDVEIILTKGCSLEDLAGARQLKSEIYEAVALDVNINRSYREDLSEGIILKKQGEIGEGYSLVIKDKLIEIIGEGSAGLFYGIQTLRQIIRQEGLELPALAITDEPYFKNRGFYHDVTRGKVPTLETLKELVDRLSFYKINHLELYIEHTFAFKGFTEIWTGRDPLTSEEILELDAYCIERHVELVPSLSTFGHLYELLISRSYSHLSELEIDYHRPFSWMDRMAHHTLDVSNSESIQVVGRMLEQFVPLFSSKKFNICCDETFDLGKGKNKELLEKVGSGRLYTDFLNKVITLVKGYDKEILFWGDIILKHPEYLSEIPKDVTCLNWGYHAEVTEDDTKTIAESGLKQYVCPSIAGWNRLINVFDLSFVNITKMVSFGKKYGAEGILNTDWGDHGHVNLLGSSTPGMIFGASLSWNPEEELSIEEADKAISVIEYGDTEENLMAVLRELSRHQPFHWSYLTFWRERKLQAPERINPWLEKIEAIEEEEVLKAYEEGHKASKALKKKVRNIYADRRLDMEEFISAADGISLMAAAYLPIKKHTFNHESIDYIVRPKELAEAFDLWLDGYGKLWRSRNKESELIRIREAVYNLTEYLRTV